MKTIWNVLCVVALANLLGLAAFLGWLIGTDRVDVARVRQIREQLSETVTEQRVREEAAKLEQEAAAKAATEGETKPPEPLASSEVLALKHLVSEADRQRLERLRREVDDLKTTLARERRVLDDERAAFVTERDAFLAERQRIAATEGEEQFKKALKTYDAMEPEVVRGLFDGLLRPAGGAALDPEGLRVVVGYLNAMAVDRRAAILAEFAATDPKLAADLLERVRNRGLVADSSGKPGG